MLITGLAIAASAIVIGLTPSPAKRRLRRKNGPRVSRPRRQTVAPSRLPTVARINALFSARKRHLGEMVVIDPQKAALQKRLSRDLAIVAVGAAAGALGSLLYAPLVLISLVGVIRNGRTIYVRGWGHLVKERRVSMDVLNMALIAILIGTGAFIAANIPVILSLIREKMVIKAKGASKASILKVFNLQPRTVFILSEGCELEIPSDQLHPDHVVVVNAGETIPVDGVVTDGSASVDQRLLTGEPQPVEKEAGDEVFAMTMVLSGRLYIQATKTGADTAAAQIGALLNQTIEAKSDAQLQAEATVERIMLPTLLLGAASSPFIGLSGAGAILNTPPKDNVAIAGSIGVLNYLNLASREGVLVKDGRALERLNAVDTVIFDKTGTLTEDQPTVRAVTPCAEMDEDDVLRHVAAVERKQSHPIAKAILQAAEDRGLALPEAEDVSVNVGYGLAAKVEGRMVHVGGERFMAREAIALPPEIEALQTACAERGDSLVLAAVDGRVQGAIELRPTIRPEAAAVIRRLQDGGKIVVVISGDKDAPTASLAEALGVDRYYAQTLPEDKARIVAEMQAEGRVTCFIGDGINDAVALGQADVGVSMRGAAGAATDTAQIILMNGGLTKLCPLFDLAKECQNRLRSTYFIVGLFPVLCVSGVLFFGLGFLHTVLLNQIGFLSGAANTTAPLLMRRDEDDAFAGQEEKNQ